MVLTQGAVFTSKCKIYVTKGTVKGTSLVT